MTITVLHLLSQRPLATGSGVTLGSLVEEAARKGYEQHAVCASPASEPQPTIAGLDRDHIHPLLFETEPLDYPVPGMSDVMPYPSTRFASLDDERWGGYRASWREHLERVISKVEPDVIHSHHAWLMSSLVKNLAPDTPLVVHSHATGLRQLELCPNRASEVREGVARADHYCVLHGAHERELIKSLGVPKSRVSIVGAGYPESLYHARGRERSHGKSVLYVGKLSAAKGVPELVQAFARVLKRVPDAKLHVVGAGSGSEGEWIDREIASLGDAVVLYGVVNQSVLADRMRASDVCVLPSYYEGLPLVLVSAAASGCELVSTTLPGVVNELAPHLGERLHLVPLPPMASIDKPKPEALPKFVTELAIALEEAMQASTTRADAVSLEPFTWGAVFGRIEKIWSRLSASV